jgi:hypothetical protein
MTRTNITLVYDDDKFLNSVLLNVVEQLKAGEQKGKFARLGISVEVRTRNFNRHQHVRCSLRKWLFNYKI